MQESCQQRPNANDYHLDSDSQMRIILICAHYTTSAQICQYVFIRIDIRFIHTALAAHYVKCQYVISLIAIRVDSGTLIRLILKVSDMRKLLILLGFLAAMAEVALNGTFNLYAAWLGGLPILGIISHG